MVGCSGGISRGHDPAARENNANYALPPYGGAPDALNEAVLPFVVDWIYTTYLLARKFGGYRLQEAHDPHGVRTVGGLRG